MVKDYLEQSTEMFTVAGFKNIQTNDSHQAPGLDIHEMGGVRMGKDPNIAAQCVEPTARLQKRFCSRWQS